MIFRETDFVETQEVRCLALVHTYERMLMVSSRGDGFMCCLESGSVQESEGRRLGAKRERYVDERELVGDVVCCMGHRETYAWDEGLGARMHLSC